MPSSPKIQKETILETALQMLIRDGYSAINIKSLAKELGCSTQPISRQFGSMEGLREELLDYCLEFLKTIFCLKDENVFDIIMGIAQGYINLAFDYPNLYKYLYMNEQDGNKMGNLTRSLRASNYDKVIEMLEQEYDISTEEANNYMHNMDFYIHGIASYTAIGFVDASKEEIMKKIYSANKAFITQVKAVNRKKICSL